VETCSTDHSGVYNDAACDTLAELATIEPTLTGAPVALEGLAATTYTIKVTATSGNTFSIKNNAGTLTYPCTTGGTGGCPETGAEDEWD
jgi:hypothetical protein